MKRKMGNVPQTIFFKIIGFSEMSWFEIISIFHGCMVWIEKSVTRVKPSDADQ